MIAVPGSDTQTSVDGGRTGIGHRRVPRTAKLCAEPSMKWPMPMKGKEAPNMPLRQRESRTFAELRQNLFHNSLPHRLRFAAEAGVCPAIHPSRRSFWQKPKPGALSQAARLSHAIRDPWLSVPASQRV